jgi:hypothetical protein
MMNDRLKRMGDSEDIAQAFECFDTTGTGGYLPAVVSQQHPQWPSSFPRGEGVVGRGARSNREEFKRERVRAHSDAGEIARVRVVTARSAVWFRCAGAGAVFLTHAWFWGVCVYSFLYDPGTISLNTLRDVLQGKFGGESFTDREVRELAKLGGGGDSIAYNDLISAMLGSN